MRLGPVAVALLSLAAGALAADAAFPRHGQAYVGSVGVLNEGPIEVLVGAPLPRCLPNHSHDPFGTTYFGLLDAVVRGGPGRHYNAWGLPMSEPHGAFLFVGAACATNDPGFFYMEGTGMFLHD